IGGQRSSAPDPPGFHPAQGDAHRACLGTGVHLVWGPPGTGKTTVLKRSIGDLIARGDRVLLVSATNIAVDNALLGVVKEHRHAPGDIVRVGTPQLREVADNPGVSLPLMVRDRLAGTAERRRETEAALVDIRARAAELAALDTALVRFDAKAYFAALKVLRTSGGDVASREARAAEAVAEVREAESAERSAARAVAEAERLSDAAKQSRAQWAEVARLREEQSRVLRAAERKEAAVPPAETAFADLREELRLFDTKGSVARWRGRFERQELAERLQAAEKDAARVRRKARSARAAATARTAEFDAQLGELIPGIEYTPERIDALEAARGQARSDWKAALDRTSTAHRAVADMDASTERVSAADALTKEAEQHKWPALHARAERMRPGVKAAHLRRADLEMRFQELQEEYERLARNAQGEIIKSAKLVATTLARFRSNKAVFEGPYDVVLVDEAGAATLPEVILAAAKATRTVVLLGDFMQLGPVIEQGLKDLDRPDVKRWLLPDVFQHCGISDPKDAQRHPACVTLSEQHRFGPAVMRLANGLAYGGTLTGGERAAADRPEDDPEIVIVDTDGLHELAQAHLTGKRSGWWPAGSLIARALVEYHRELGDDAGIVTPYGAQEAATLEALRDIESGGGPLAEVGTAHRFQGREFPVVVFDTVEGADGRELWMALARHGPGANGWERDGLRLFNVAVTRARTRLYVIGSWERISTAGTGTAFAQLAAMAGTTGVRRLRANQLITPPHGSDRELGVFGAALADVLARHVEVTDIDDERSFYSTFEDEIREAHTSLWLWAPWVANRVRSLLPLLRDAVGRGVRVTVFLRDDTDQLQRRLANQGLIADLAAIAHTVVPVNVMHQKIVVVDERTVMIGSLNTLSQSWTREVMLTMRGGHFARRMLENQNARLFADPPKCGRCGGGSIELRRRTNGSWFWRCYDTVCKTVANGRSQAWNRDIRLGGGKR
ncbi:AAA domain-containing protein, partial [Streptomyces albipurpureus]